MGIAHLRAALMPRGIVAAALALALAMIAHPAQAHDQPFSRVEIHWERERVTMRVELHPDDAATLGGGDGLIERVRHGLRLESNRVPMPLHERATAIDPTTKRVVLTFDAPTTPASSLRVDWDLFPASAQHETYLNVFAGGKLVSQGVLTAEHPREVIERAENGGASAVLVRYAAEGVHHIFIGPDHILFMVGLVLLGGGVLRILKIATAFTAAHSITLALAALGVLRPPPGVVEPLIALSIVYVGIHNLRSCGSGHDARTAIAFAFGLMHGFGFASVLTEVGLPREALAWSLLGFNLGVEAGQVCIVLLVAPALGLLSKRTPALARRVVAAASIGIVLAGGYWLVERVAASWA